MKTSELIDLFFMYRVHNDARVKFGFLRFGHFAKRRNNSACSAEVLRINFLALSTDIARDLFRWPEAKKVLLDRADEAEVCRGNRVVTIVDHVPRVLPKTRRDVGPAQKN